MTERDQKTSKPARSGRLIRVVMVLCLLVGIACIAYPLVANLAYELGAYNAVSSYRDSLSRYSDEELERMWAEAYAYNDELGNPQVRDPFGYDDIVPPLDRYFEVLNPDGTGMMGYVEVPSANLRLPVYHGTSDEVLEQGVGHIATSALPIDGISIHPILTGHTGLPGKVLFTNLSLVREGDLVRMVVLDKTFAYRVTSVDIIEPDDTSLLQPAAGENRLTLFTCTPYGINSHRLLVTGVPVADDGSGGGGLPLSLLWTALGLLAVLIAAFTITVILRRRKRRRIEAMADARAKVEAPESMQPAPARIGESTRAYTIVLVVLGAAILAVAWAAIGVAMYTGYIPYFNLGYDWLEELRTPG